MPTHKQRAVFYGEMATLEGAGVPLMEALPLARAHAGGGALGEALQRVEDAIHNKGSLYDAIRREPETFTPLECALIRAGAQAGKLEEVFRGLSGWFEFRRDLERDFVMRLIYPVILIHVAALILPFPSFFTGNGSLPAYAFAAGCILAPFYAAVLFAFKVLPALRRSNSSVAGATDGILLAVPFVRGVVIKLDMLRFATVYHMAASTGLPIYETIELCASVCVNTHIRARAAGLRSTAEAGLPLSVGMKQAGLFPEMVIHMFETGERSGTTDESAGKVADYYRTETDIALRMLAKALSFLVYFGIVAFIGYRIVSFYVGMYSGALNGLGD
ncbi:MAG: type II secretion system F family protein [Planctomycetota bacterium]